nr:hypothetical protein KPHV_22620 [Kitasatospora purpeofusca]
MGQAKRRRNCGAYPLGWEAEVRGGEAQASLGDAANAVTNSDWYRDNDRDDGQGRTYRILLHKGRDSTACDPVGALAVAPPWWWISANAALPDQAARTEAAYAIAHVQLAIAAPGHKNKGVIQALLHEAAAKYTGLGYRLLALDHTPQDRGYFEYLGYISVPFLALSSAGLDGEQSVLLQYPPLGMRYALLPLSDRVRLDGTVAAADTYPVLVAPAFSRVLT